MKQIRVKRIYDAWEKADGYRVLTDRLWPRGITKADANLDEWAKEFAPSSPLRKQVHQEEITWPAFSEAYQKELAENPGFPLWVDALVEILLDDNITFLTAAKPEPRSYVDILKAAVEKHI